MADQSALSAGLREIVADYKSRGVDLSTDPRLAEAILLDSFPESPAEIHALVEAIRSGAIQYMADRAPQGLEFSLHGSASQLTDSAGLRPDLARWAVESWWNALQLGPPVDISTASGGAAPPTPPAGPSAAGSPTAPLAEAAGVAGVAAAAGAFAGSEDMTRTVGADVPGAPDVQPPAGAPPWTPPTTPVQPAGAEPPAAPPVPPTGQQYAGQQYAGAQPPPGGPPPYSGTPQYTGAQPPPGGPPPYSGTPQQAGGQPYNPQQYTGQQGGAHVPPPGGQGFVGQPGGPPQPPKQGSRGRLLAAGAVVVIIIAYFGVAAGAKLPPFAKTTTTTTTTTTLPSTTSTTLPPTTTTTTIVTPTTSATVSAQLASAIPNESSDCSPESAKEVATFGTGAEASYSCSEDNGLTVLYTEYSSSANAKKEYDGVITHFVPGGLSGLKQGNCTQDNEQTDYTPKNSSTDIGVISCFKSTGGDQTLLWWRFSDNIVTIALGSTLSLATETSDWVGLGPH